MTNDIPFNFKYCIKHEKCGTLDIIEGFLDKNNIFEGHKKQLDKKKCFHTVSINLKISSQFSNPIYYSRKKAEYTKLSKAMTAPVYFTYSNMIHIVDSLEMKDYIESKRGFHSKRYPENCKRSTIYPQKNIVEELLNEIDFKDIDLVKPSLVVLRNRNQSKGASPFPKIRKVDKMISELEIYNELRRSQNISISGLCQNQLDKYFPYLVHYSIDKNLKPNIVIKMSPGWVRRIFSDTLTQGGRFYGGLEMNLSKELRSKILINGNETSEIDYNGLHIHMLYHKNKISFSEDPYLFLSNYSPVERGMMKTTALISINAKDRISALRAIKTAMKEKNETDTSISFNYTALEYLSKWETQHPKIQNYYYSDEGVKLQYKDSCIANDIIQHFTKKNILVLCVHDSFIIEKSHRSELEQVMKDTYKKRMGFDIGIKG